MEERTQGEIPARVKAIMDLGVSITFDYSYMTPEQSGGERHRVVIQDRISSVGGVLTDRDWVQITTREGDYYVGGCCGKMSQLQDHINGVFRDGGFFDHDEFKRIASMARGHDGFEEWEPVDDYVFFERIAYWKKIRSQSENQPVGDEALDPWWRLGQIFLAVEDYLEPSPSMDLPSVESPDEKEHPGSYWWKVLGDTLNHAMFFDLFSDESKEKSGHEAQRKLLHAQALPALRFLLNAIEEQGVEFDGFAIVNEETQEIYSDRWGLCIYLDREAAERVMREWEKHRREEEQMNKRRNDHALQRLGQLALSSDPDDAKRFAEEKERLLSLKEHDEHYFWADQTGKIVPVRVAKDTGYEVLIVDEVTDAG